MRLSLMLTEEVKKTLREVCGPEDVQSFLKSKGLNVTLEVAESLYQYRKQNLTQWLEPFEYHPGSLEYFDTVRMNNGALRLMHLNNRVGNILIDIPEYTQGLLVTSYSQIHISYWCGFPDETDVIIPDSINEISDFCFWGSRGMKSVTIPNSVRSVGCLAFWRCEDLERVVLPDTVTIIRKGTFALCKNLTEVVLPNFLTTIEGGAFIECTSLHQIVLPQSLKSIEYAAFRNCVSLSNIIVPARFTFLIEKHVFDGCENLDLASFTFDYSHASVEQAIEELNRVLMVISNVYLAGANSLYTFTIKEINPPANGDITEEIESVEYAIVEFVERTIFGWIWFAENELQQNIDNIEDKTIGYICRILTDTFNFYGAKVFYCSQSVSDYYEKITCFLWSIRYVRILDRWYAMWIEWSD